MSEELIKLEDVKSEDVKPDLVKRGRGRPAGSKNGVPSVDQEEAKSKHNNFMKGYYQKNREVMLQRAKEFSKKKYHSNEKFRKECNEKSNQYRKKQQEKLKQLEEKVKELNAKLV